MNTKPKALSSRSKTRNKITGQRNRTTLKLIESPAHRRMRTMESLILVSTPSPRLSNPRYHPYRKFKHPPTIKPKRSLQSTKYLTPRQSNQLNTMSLLQTERLKRYQNSRATRLSERTSSLEIRLNCKRPRKARASSFSGLGL